MAGSSFRLRTKRPHVARHPGRVYCTGCTAWHRPADVYCYEWIRLTPGPISTQSHEQA